MKLKAILDTALSECGFPPEALYAGNPSPSARQVFDLANRELRTLSKFPWQALRKSHAITLTTATEYSLPSDFRQFVPHSLWSNSLVRPVELPASDEVWGYLKSRTVDGLRYRAKLIGGKLQIHAPQAGDVLRFDYISSAPARDRQNLSLERFTADTDTCVLDDDMLILGVVWRFKKAKGLEDWQVDLGEYSAYKRSLMASDQGSRTFNMGGSEGARINPPQLDTWA